MDKYEYKQKTEEMLELMREGSCRKAAEIADSIDWKRVRNASMLADVSEIYEKIRDYGKSYQVLRLAYHRVDGSRKIISRLCTLAVKTGNIDEAIDFYDDFLHVAPKDPNQYILRYQILRAQKAPIEQQIEALEEYKKSEYIEEWAYELAKLYQAAGMTTECLEECDDLILWFSEGQYVYKAMELKMQYKPLTPSQQERYDKRFAGLDGETEEMPDISTYAETKDGPAADKADEEAETGKTEDKAPEEPGESEEVKNEAVEDTGDAGQMKPGNEDDKEIEAGPPGEPDGTDSEKTEAPANADEAAEAEVKTEKPTAAASVQKKKLGNTMPLDEALRMLLHLEPKQPEPEKGEAENEAEAKAEPEVQNEAGAESGDEAGLKDLERAMDEIEAVVDIDMVKELAEQKAKKRIPASSKGKMTEIIPDEDIAPEPEAVLAEEDTEDSLAEADTEDVLSEADAEDILLDADDAEEFFSESDETEEIIIPQEGETEGELMTEQKIKKAEPILPPDIQRMIDEIEGVIPEEEKTVPAPKPKKDEEPRENMGKLADSLRLDDDEDYDDYDFDDAEDFDEDEEAYEEADEYLDEEVYGEADEYPDEEAYGEADEYLDEEEYEEADEYPDEEVYEETDEYLDEEAYEEVDEYPDEVTYEEVDEYPDEDGEEYDEEDEYEESEEEIADWDADLFSEEDVVDSIDDREIPDDDDDNMDILSATTPLSRKETAKMIATGKTAPLPLDEISDALSMTDTGFIVHGRYDLGIQSGIGTRAGLTEDQKKLFSYFVPVRGMSEQLVDVLEQDKNCTNRQGTSRTGNLLIVGNKGNGKTVLAVDVVKAIQKQRNIHQGKVAIVTGDSLNKKKISDIFDKLYGGALIIEKAGKMNEKTVARLNKAMEKDTGELLVVLEEQRKPIDRLLSSNREFRRKFTSRLEVPIFINDELVTFGQTYAQENGYRIDEMGILALYSKIDSLQREDHAVTVAEVKEIMDDAIRHSQKASAKKLMKRVFGKNTDEADRILLSEKDFNI